MTPRRRRLLIFVVASHAEATLRPLLERIPPSIFQQFDCEVLVVDDASEDRTYAIGQEFKAAHGEIRTTVLRNALHQGYGGNQKVGYAYAVAGKFDFVALLHGSGYYAPEALPELIGPLAEGAADAVIGSRMTAPREARAGTPLHRYLANRLLTRLENALLGTRFTDLHSGYRLYSVAALEKVFYENNSNGYDFDTELLIQLLNLGARVVELPIAPYVAREIGQLRGLAYAKNVAIATLRNAFHRAGLLYQRRFDPKVSNNVHYELKLGYPSSHTYALEAVPPGAKVLDIGAGPELMARELVRKGCEAAAVDQFAPPGADPRVKFFQQDLDRPFEVDVRPYDVILMLDILEHLKAPERLLSDLRRQFDYRPRKVVITTPNVAFFVIRLMLLLGQFNQGKAGILDYTHTRYFTFRTLRRLVRDSGLKIVRMRGIPAPFPKVLGNGRLGRLAVAVNLGLIRLSRTLFSYQILVEAESMPDVGFVLKDAQERSAS